MNVSSGSTFKASSVTRPGSPTIDICMIKKYDKKGLVVVVNIQRIIISICTHSSAVLLQLDTIMFNEHHYSQRNLGLVDRLKKKKN